jgi:transketolase
LATPTVEAHLDQLAIDTIRTLAMDAVQQANSGHPGTPMALAPLAYYLWGRQLRFDPEAPQWPDRDRFVLSNGHASMLLYAMLHLSGYDVSMEDLKQFRQWGSRTPGHPERGETPGVEVTTGPLGQGFANAVGMAIAEQMLAARFNRPDHEIVNHHTFVICGDGCLMEGVSNESASLAGHLHLGKLICYYDDNHISIAGSTRLAFSEDVAERFRGAGWHTTRVEDVNDVAALAEATEEARAETTRPSLILVQSVIGYGSPHRAGTKEAHGEPLGEEEVRLTKRVYGWPEEARFLVPEEVRERFRGLVDRARSQRTAWEARRASYRQAYPKEAAEFERVMSGQLPQGWESACRSLEIPDTPEATRSSGGRVLQEIAKLVPELVGGSADLDPSTKTFLKTSPNFDLLHREGRNIQYGVREHAMGAIVNGLAAHGGLRPFAATFFVFSDYMRPPLRLAALSRLPSIFVYTHDSIGLGEDGPTHEPIEHLASLRAMPHLHVIRPADARETAEAWMAALERTDGPTVLVLSRQNLPQLDRGRAALGAEEGALRGGYIVRECDGGDPELVLIATGSEVSLALEAAARLESDERRVRVVSLPCWEIFECQDATYREAVLGSSSTPRISIEAGATFGWERYLGARGVAIGVDRFGASAPGATVLRELGITAERAVSVAKELLA